jgi:glutathione S-transferase
MVRVVLHHAPRSRSFRALWFLEELGTAYDLVPLSLDAGGQKAPEVVKLNPMGKVPVVVVDGHAVWESPAIIAHLCDCFPEAGLAPAPGTPARADFYRWLSFATAVMEPAFMDNRMQRESNPRAAGWGDFPSMKAALATGLAGGPWILGDAFSGADVLVGGNASWFSMWAAEAFADVPGLDAYVARVRARPAFQRATEIDEGLVAAQESGSADSASRTK